MGTSCSCVPTTKQNKIEDSSNEDASEDGTTELKDHNEVVQIPVDYPKSGTKKSISLRSFGSFKKSFGRIRKTESLQSSVLLGTDVTALKREYDIYKREKQSELSEISSKLERVSNENKRIRAELKTVQSTCSRLRSDRDKAAEAESLALARASSFEQEKNKVQRQFKQYKESKETELQTLIRECHSLSLRLKQYKEEDSDDSDNGNIEKKAFTASGSYVPGTANTDLMLVDDAESFLGGQVRLQAKGVEFGNDDGWSSTNATIKKGDWHGVVQNLVRSLDATFLCLPEGNVYRVYIVSTEDVEPAANLLVKMCSQLVHECEFEGRFLSLVHIPVADMKASSEADRLRVSSLRLEQSKKCNILVALLGDTAETCIFDECYQSALDETIQKPSVFCLLEETSSSGISKRIRNLLATSKTNQVCVFDQCSSSEVTAQNAFDGLEKVVRQFLSRQNNHNSGAFLFPYDEADWCVGCGWDMYSDQEQFQALELAENSSCEPLGLEQYFSLLDDHVAGDVPMQPLLVRGPAGCGKSLLLSRWISGRTTELNTGCILYHFVSSKSSLSADPAQLTRRLTVQLMQQVALHSLASNDHSRLEDEFPRWLEAVSARMPNGIVLVIDGGDRLQNHGTTLKWLLDPLPVNTHVIVSVGSDSYPNEWRSWPTVLMESLTVESSQELLLQEYNNDPLPIPDELVFQIYNSETGNLLSLPLYVSLMASELSRCRSYQELSTITDILLESKSLVSLYESIIMLMENEHGTHFMSKILSHICMTRNGLSETELMQLFHIPWVHWVQVLDGLVSRRLVTLRNGLMICNNNSVEEAVRLRYDISDDTACTSHVQQSLINLFHSKLIPGKVTFRVADELPWLLLKIDQKEMLRDCINTMCIFVRLLRRGRCVELLHYWQCIGEDHQGMAESYFNFIKHLEENPEFAPRVPMLYDTLGRFLISIGLLDYAIKPLERSLELREATLDPDHPSIALSFHNLGMLYCKWKKFRAAETLYKQALEVNENSYGQDHQCIAKELESLAQLYAIEDKVALAEPLRKRALEINEKHSHLQSTALVTDIIVAFDSNRDVILKMDSCADIGKSLNDLGVLFFIQNENGLAEALFERSLLVRESCIGKHHPDYAQSLHNLGALYNAKEKYADAEELYHAAWEIRLECLSIENPCLQSTLRHLAAVYRKQKKYEEAEHLYRKLLDIREKCFGEDHPSVASSLNSLAVLMCQMNNREEAWFLYERALKLYEGHLGIGNPKVSEILKNMAKLKYDQGCLDVAADLYRYSMDNNRSRRPLTVSADMRRTSDAISSRGEDTSVGMSHNSSMFERT